MIKSMTGFSSLTRDDGVVAVGVTVRSVNHRYLDVQVRVPQGFVGLEHDLRELVGKYVTRGRIEIAVTVKSINPPTVKVDINKSLVSALVDAAESDAVRRSVEGGWTVGDLLRFPKVITVTEQCSDPTADKKLHLAVRVSVDDALGELDAMRCKEGEFLGSDLDGMHEALAVLVNRIEAEAISGQAALEERLSTRVAELSTETVEDSSALAQEVVRWVARTDIHEELSRLRGHLNHWLELVGASDACGRRLDFLLQEMNREVNTIGSKASGSAMSQLIVGTKAELEKLREQVQNVE